MASSFFKQEDIIQPQTTQQKVLQPTKGGFFDEADVVYETAPAPAQPTASTAPLETIPDDIWEKLMSVEGRELTQDPTDPGGATKFGISQRANPDVDVPNLTEEQARQIYNERYWRVIPVEYRDWDMFQRVVHQGPSVIKQTAGLSPRERKEKDIDKYLGIIGNKPDQKKYLNGWMNRVVGQDVFGDNKVNLKDMSPEEIKSTVTGYLAEEKVAKGGFFNEADVVDKDVGFVGGLVEGVREALVPYWVGEEEYKNIDSIKEIGGSLAGNILGSLAAGGAASAATGAALGSVVPGIGTAVGAVAGAVAYGIYAGFGTEYLRSRYEGQNFDPVRGVVNAAMEVNPLVKSSKKFVRALRAGAQVVAATGLEASYAKGMEDKEAANQRVAIAGLLTAAFSPLIARSMKPNEKLSSPKTIDAVQEMMAGEEGLNLFTRAKEKLAKKGDKLPSEWPVEFKRWFIDRPGAKAKAVEKEFIKKTQNLSSEIVQDSWRTFSFQQAVLEEISTERNRMSSKISKKGLADPFSKPGEWLKDAKFIARDVDQKLGMNFEGTLDMFSEARNKHNVVTSGYIKKALQVTKAGRKLGLDDADIGKALAGKMDDVTPKGRRLIGTDKGKQVVDGWRDLFDTVRDELRRKGYEIGHLENYFPMQALREGDFASAVRRQYEVISEGMQEQGAKALSDLTGEAAEARDRVMKVASHLGERIEELRDVDEFVTSVLSRRTKKRVGYELSAMFERRGEMPDFIRNYNVGDVFLGYINGNMKAAHFHDAFQMMRANVEVARALGMENTTKYFQRYLDDLSGKDTGWVSMWQSNMERMRYKANEILAGSPSQWDRTYARSLKAAPDFMSFMSSIVYPSFLGWNARAAIRNLSQPLLMTAPELGQGGYGYKLTAKGAIKAAAKRARGLDVDGFLQEKHLLGDHQRFEAITRQEVGKFANLQHLANEIGDISMWAYGKTDSINRYVTWNIAEEWAKDIAAGNKQAIKALRNLSTGAKSAIKASGSIQEGDVNQLTDQLARYLIGKTQFHYGREQLAQFGRHFGRMFSMFSKWPVMIGSDIVDIYKRNSPYYASMRMMEKYLGPTLALMALGNYVLETEEEPMLKYLMGDPASYSPLNSVKALAEGSMGSPIIQFGRGSVAGLVDLVTQGTSGEGIKRTVRRGIKQTAKTFIPGASAVLNEADRFKKAWGEQTLTDKLLEDMGLPESKR